MGSSIVGENAKNVRGIVFSSNDEHLIQGLEIILKNQLTVLLDNVSKIRKDQNGQYSLIVDLKSNKDHEETALDLQNCVQPWCIKNDIKFDISRILNN